jgi:hypothetical protein
MAVDAFLVVLSGCFWIRALYVHSVPSERHWQNWHAIVSGFFTLLFASDLYRAKKLG